MNEEKGTGVFGSVGNASQNTCGEARSVVLNPLSEDSQDTIYNLIFKDFDEEKSE